MSSSTTDADAGTSPSRLWTWRAFPAGLSSCVRPAALTPQDIYLVSHLGEVSLHRVRIFPICVILGLHFTDPGDGRCRKERPKSEGKFSPLFWHPLLLRQHIYFPLKNPFGDSKPHFQCGLPFALSSS